MGYKYNPFTGTLDITGSGSGTTFDPDTILTSNFFEVITDQLGNVLVSA